MKIFIGFCNNQEMVGGIHKGPICSSRFEHQLDSGVGVRLTFVIWDDKKLYVRGWIGKHERQGMHTNTVRSKILIR